MYNIQQISAICHAEHGFTVNTLKEIRDNFDLGVDFSLRHEMENMSVTIPAGASIRQIADLFGRIVRELPGQVLPPIQVHYKPNHHLEVTQIVVTNEPIDVEKMVHATENREYRLLVLGEQFPSIINKIMLFPQRYFQLVEEKAAAINE